MYFQMNKDFDGLFEFEFNVSTQEEVAVWLDAVAADQRKQILRDAVTNFQRHERARVKALLWGALYSAHPINDARDIEALAAFVYGTKYARGPVKWYGAKTGQFTQTHPAEEVVKADFSEIDKRALMDDQITSERLRQAQQDAMAAKVKAHSDNLREQIEKAKIATRAASDDAHHFWKHSGE
jgi:hypothetical protein